MTNDSPLVKNKAGGLGVSWPPEARGFWLASVELFLGILLRYAQDAVIFPNAMLRALLSFLTLCSGRCYLS